MKQQEFFVIVGKRIAGYRKERKMTQVVLSDLCDMEQSNLARLESGKMNLTLETLFKLSKALDVPVKNFFDFE